MDPTIQELAEDLLEKADPEGRLLIAVSGVPGSGKSNLALRVVNRVNSLHRSRQRSASYASQDTDDEEEDVPDVAICVSQDGWHLPRSALDEMDDRQHAYDRRGAAFTFDGVAFASFMITLSACPSAIRSRDYADVTAATEDYSSSSGDKMTIISAPSFSHTLKDPEAGTIQIRKHHRIILVEGLYTFLNVEPWKVASALFHERWFVDAGERLARTRLLKRHVATGVAKDMQEAEWRAENNDIPSRSRTSFRDGHRWKSPIAPYAGKDGKYVIDHMLEPTRIITSIEDPRLASEAGRE